MTNPFQDPFFQRAFLEAGPNDVVQFYMPFHSSKLFGITGKTALLFIEKYLLGKKVAG